MMISRMAVCIVGATLLVQANNAFAFSADAVADAEKLIASTADRYKKGEVTATDVAQAEAYLLDMKLEAGLITNTDYCAGVLPQLQAVLNGITREASVGQRTTAEIIAAQRELHRVRSRCGQK